MRFVTWCKKALPTITQILWVVLIASLPLTSVQLLARLFGSDAVASPAILVVFFMVVIWLFPYLLQGGKLVGSSIPLFLFGMVAVIATLLSYFQVIPAYKGIDNINSTVEAVITLVIGVCFYLVSSSYMKDEKQAKLTLKIINWSGLFMLLWAGMQAVAWQGFGRYPQWMFDLQGFVSKRVLYRQRVTGLALEPSWFAHQLNMVYLPIWLSATIKGFTAHNKKLGFLTLENFLLMAGIGALLLTLSRVGLLAFILMFTFFLIKLHTYLVEKTLAHLSRKQEEEISGERKKRLKVIVSVLFIIAYMILLVLGLWIFSKVDPRMENLFSFSFGNDNPLLSYFNELSFGERVVYWLAGWNTFTEHPILGVGLGNAGYYFPKAITPYGWNLIEVRQLVYRSSNLMNVKSLWVRLLAETGMVGFSFFCGWLYSMVVKFGKKANSQKKLVSVYATAGIFMLCALIAEGFSIDSFAMPYLWVGLGLASADFADETAKKESHI
ncbi:MAG TPA: hypothetical protein DCK95_10620 [Anaerolineaceae bacterium]|uniref:O-antigen polymerase family protein n=1 Tax=Anaerolinea thermophila TaxID=167964 RepID=A0A101FYV6_9CHLR|nr:MAG: O-antigen polymerase family protein [Anaerolinea thermophila]HAF62761.1 hypothetical protein [Anaerolineaceae bacterium]